MVLLEEPQIVQQPIQVRFGKLGYFLGELFLLAHETFRYYPMPIIGMCGATDVASTATDDWGWNIRNRVSHGILRSEHCTRVIADRLIHVLLLLGDLRAGESPSG